MDNFCQMHVFLLFFYKKKKKLKKMDSKESPIVEPDSLDELEKDFNTVMGTILADDHLSQFAEQYKQLLDAFMDSHKNNAQLIEKVRLLNTEIVQNSTKVTSVLSLSQDDQRTISGLKFEFEKAWKMVEISQEKEQKSREIIESLKEETKKLGKMAEQGGAQSLQQENSLDQLKKDIASLQREVAIQQTQIDTLSKDNDNWKKKIDELKSQTQLYVNEQETMNETLNQLKDQEKGVEDEVSDLMQQVQKRKDEIVEENTEIKTFDERYTNAGVNLEAVEKAKEEAREELRDMIEQKNDSLGRVNVAQKLLENKQQQGLKIKKDIEEVKKKIQDKIDYFTSFSSSTKDAVDQYDQNEKELKHHVQEREKVRLEIDKTRNRLNQCRQEIYRLQHELISLETEVGYAQRAVSLSQHAGSLIKADIINEKKNLEAAERNTNGVYVDLANTKMEKNEYEIKTQNLLQEIEKHSANTNQARTNAMISENQSRQNNDEKKELEIKLNDIQSRIQRIESLQKSLMQERDLTRRQLESMKQEAANIENENLLLANDISNTKELIRQKDFECISVHKMREEIKEIIPELEKQKTQEEKKLKDITLAISTKYNELVRTRYYCDVADTNVRDISIYVKSLQNGFHSNELQINSRQEESGVLREKINSLRWRIQTGSTQYNTICDKVEDLKDQLKSEVRRNKFLLEKSKHNNALFKEYMQTEKQVLRLKSQVRALEDELETPMNVHRWRFLEGTNAEQMNLIKMVMSLRDTLMVKMSTIQRLKDTLRQIQEQSEREIKKVRNVNKEEQEMQINFYQNVLQTQNAQLKIVEKNLHEQSAVLGEGRDSVTNIRSQLRDVKMDYYAIKGKTTQMRASSQIQQPVKSLLPESKTKFIGGGFVTSKSHAKSSLSKEEDPLPNSPESPILSPMLKSSHIVVPTRGSHKSTQGIHSLLGAKKPLPKLQNITE